MAQTKTITVASRVPMAIQMRQTEPNPGAPGTSFQLGQVVINGSGDDGTTEGFTTGVDEKIFDEWLKANANHPAVINGLLRKVPDDEAADPIVYGFEPALAAAEEEAKDADKDSDDKAKKLDAKKN